MLQLSSKRADLSKLQLPGLREGPQQGCVADKEDEEARGKALREGSPHGCRLRVCQRAELAQVLHSASKQNIQPKCTRRAIYSQSDSALLIKTYLNRKPEGT